MKNIKKLLRENRKLLLTLVAVFILYHVAFANRVIPGVTVGGVKVGGKTSTQVEKALREKFETSAIQVTFNYENDEFYITDDEIDLEYKLRESVERAFYLGRSGNIYVDSKDKLAALIKGIKLNPVYSYSDTKLKQKVVLIEGLTNIQYIEPSFILVDGNLVASKGQEGRILDSDFVKFQIFNSINTISSNYHELPVHIAKSDVSEDDLLTVKTDVEKYISQSPLVTYQDKKWTYSKEDVLSLLSYRKENGDVRVVSNKVLVD